MWGSLNHPLPCGYAYVVPIPYHLTQYNLRHAYVDRECIFLFGQNPDILTAQNDQILRPQIDADDILTIILETWVTNQHRMRMTSRHLPPTTNK